MMHSVEYLYEHTRNTLREGGIMLPMDRNVIDSSAQYTHDYDDLLKLTVIDEDTLFILTFDGSDTPIEEMTEGSIFDLKTNKRIAHVEKIDRVEAMANYMIQIMSDKIIFIV